jgi:FtsP/CotA-like multicopper oxidase with cupredoxin domain
VRWYVVGLGTEVDLHTAHWHGETVMEGGWQFGRRTDVVELLPASMKTVDMKADNPGTWLFHCHVNDHIIAGMSTRWTVK